MHAHAHGIRGQSRNGISRRIFLPEIAYRGHHSAGFGAGKSSALRPVSVQAVNIAEMIARELLPDQEMAVAVLAQIVFIPERDVLPDLLHRLKGLPLRP